MRRRVWAGLAALALVLAMGGTAATATPTDPCESSYTGTMNSTAKLKAYMDCRLDRLDKGLTPGPTVTVTITATPSPSVTATPSPPASATPTATASQTPTASPTATTTGLALAKEPNQPAGDYYAQFPKAAAAGWGKDFIPVSVFLGKPEHAAQLKAVGINTYMGAEHDGSQISVITGQGMSVMAQDEWAATEIGTDTRVVAWQLSDECDMGYSGCGDSEAAQLAKQTEYANAARSRNDGRFLSANFGNGVLRTWWSPNTMPQHVALLDSTSVDKYAYTSPHVQGLLPNSPDWPTGVNAKRAAAYGWQQDQMERFQGGGSTSKPNWVFIETARPYLTEAGATIITPDQIEGGVWSAIIHGARGIAYFQHHNATGDETSSNGGCSNYSLVDAGCTANKARVKAVNAKVQILAPVINSDSYVHNYGAAGIDTMTKQSDGYLYVFAGVGLKGTAGSKTFALPAGVAGTVEVVGEDRTLNASDGSFSDTFAAEFTHHIYRIKI